MEGNGKIHFGWFIRACRDRKHQSQRKFGGVAGVSDRRISQIEQMEFPDEISGETHEGLARACEFVKADGEGDVVAFDLAWKATPVPRPEFKASPIRLSKTSEFKDSKNGEAISVLRWLSGQSPQLYREILGALLPEELRRLHIRVNEYWDAGHAAKPKTGRKSA